MISRHLARTVLLVSALLLLALPVVAAEAMQFGFAKVDVTPDEPLRLSGYGNRAEPSEGNDETLFARAMAFRHGEGPVHILVTVDTLGFPALVTKEIHERLEKAHGIARSRFALCATHTHAAPHLTATASNLFAVPLTKEETAGAEKYVVALTARVVAAVDQAIEDLAPGRMFVAEGTATFAHNRRVLKDNQWSGFGQQPAGPVDHALPILKVADASGEKVRGIVFNYACHCTTFGGDYNRVNGDWAGYATEFVEAAQPDAVALCTIGCGADANPTRTGRPATELAEAHGHEIAREVERVTDRDMAEVTVAPSASFGLADLPSERPTIGDLEKRLADRSPQTRRHAQNMLAIINRQGHLPETYPMPIQVWRFGDQFTMVFLGGEVCVDYAFRIKRELREANVWVTAYANDVFGYVASERMRDEGGYEVDGSMIYYNQPGRWSTGTEEMIFRRLHELHDECSIKP